ncbi:hypothetical protein [Actinomycetospora termitidis]|uniref:Uncharacterized protein n=1 Tax=Actinomycetospora termitidis TaxID=3053470 RepID=A0ABT7M685_9PSEU|nr:hypothetical protein [Actinomycetospora sp. Odt1-22]MDL5156140.1 hypothetical protein [Actinomycetospora sp. Odt1-22]
MTRGVERVVVEFDARAGLSELERIVGLLRGRRHPVVGLESDLTGESAVVAIWGPGLHGGDDDALVLRRLRRLPGVLHARIVSPVEAR